MNLKLCSRLVLCLTLTPAGLIAAPFDFDAAPGRLPKNVVPLSYRVSLVPNVEALTFTGLESVELKVRTATDTVQFNSLNEQLSTVRFDGKAVKSVVSDDKRQLTTVTLNAPAAPGLHVLRFSYRGRLESSPQGLYVQKYTAADGGKAVLLSTQMEATDARRMFPCWDEPAFRSKFRLSVTLPASWTSVSNMPIEKRAVHGAMATVSFAQSPAMPSYLIELTSGAIRKVSAHAGRVDLGVWVVAGQEHEGRAALANAQQILADYDAYFALPYPLPKLDSLAIPGGFSGAMENWGAITYNDQLLRVGPTSAVQDLQSVYSVQAHEMAHQWFGDLVTMGWWDDIWLNESFASWLAAKQTTARNPTWNWWESEDASKEQAMQADAHLAAHAIQQHVTDELQAANSFDPDITYSKGEALLRMLEAYLGEDAFRSGMRLYMKSRAYSNATPTDLWNALSEASGKPVAQVASDWTEKPGFPLVSVAAACDGAGERTLTLTQQRFLLSGSDATAPHWRVPLKVRWGNAAPTPVLLETDGQSVKAGRCDETLSVNADVVGYYRARYDAPTLALNTAHFASAVNGDRIALLDDQWAQVESGLAPLDSYLSLAQAMGDNLDTRAWQQIASALGTMEYAERGTPDHDAFLVFARNLLGPTARRLGASARPGETPDVSDLRQTVLGHLGAWNDPDTLVEARKRFDGFVKDRASLRPDEQSTVLRIVAQHADAPTFAALHALAKDTENETERERFYSALASVRDAALAEQVLRIVTSGELPPEAASLNMRLIFRLAGNFRKLSWDAFSANHEKLLASYPSEKALILGLSVPDVYWDTLPLGELEAWIRQRVPASGADLVDRGMETARFELAEKQALIPAIDAFLKRRE